MKSFDQYEVPELVDLIVNSSQRYYEGGEYLLSDTQFDEVVEILRKKDPNNVILQTPGWGYSPTGDKYRHIGQVPPGSLDKFKYPETPHSHLKNVVMTPKWDGITVVCYFYHGKLQMALTRGDGVSGVNVTNKMLALFEQQSPKVFENMAKEYKDDFLFSVRMEVITDKKYEKELNDRGVPSLRNFAAGIMNRIEVSDEIKYLDYKAYAVRISSVSFLSKAHMLDTLRVLGFRTTEFFTMDEFNSVDLLKDFYERWKEVYPIDGIVLSPNQLEIGSPDYTSEEPRSVAYKFASESAEVVVGKILWATGSTGRIVPTVQLAAPVNLSGASIQNVAGHNASYLEVNKIGPGAVIEITRSGEVIPYILQVRKPAEFIPPTECPTCKSLPVFNGTDMMCPNEECFSRTYEVIYRFWYLTGWVDGLGGTTLQKYLKEFPINHDETCEVTTLKKYIQKLNWVSSQTDAGLRGNLLESKFGSHYGSLLFAFENKCICKIAEGLSYSDFWYVMGFPGLGWESSRKMAAVDPRSLTWSNYEEKLISAKVASPVFASVKRYWNTWHEYSFLIKVFEKLNGKNTPKMNIAVTGSLSIPRKKFIEKCESLGIKVGSVGKETQYLVTNELSNSSKSIAAVKLGIKVIDETNFWKMIAESFDK